MNLVLHRASTPKTQPIQLFDNVFEAMGRMAPLPRKKKNAVPAKPKAAKAPKAVPAAVAVKKAVKGSFSVTDIKELFTLMKSNEIAELSLENEEIKLHIVGVRAPSPVAPAGVPYAMMAPHPQAPLPVAPPAAPAPAAPAASAPADATAAAPPEDSVPPNAKTILSPMVGTFYRAPAPDASPFVQVGDNVGDQTTLCIIEAMKVMNEIKAEMKGRVLKILVQNAQPVQFNQPLFLIDPE